MGEVKAEETPTTTTAEIEELRKYSMEADLRAAEARAALVEAERRFKVMAPKRPRDTSITNEATPSKTLKTRRKSRFLNHDKLRTDPKVKASYKKIRKDPAHIQMRKQMKYLRSDSTSKQFDWEVYLSAAKQYLNNKELDEDRERVRSLLLEGTKFAPEYRAIVDEIREGGPTVRERYFTEPDSFRKLVEAINLTIDFCTASSDDVTSLNEVEKPRDVKESTVDHKIHDDSEFLKNAPDSGVKDMELDVAGGYGVGGSLLKPTTENIKDPLRKSWIECGLDVGAYDSHLHFAAFFGQKEFVGYLLKKGADALLENSKGYLPIELAEFTKCSDVVEMLEEYS